ncbi:MAG: hypothetical protein NTX46_03705, partial [Chloroflexi bacterium]|nr:hypothetical protein [Chloroflexota bacterium]
MTRLREHVPKQPIYNLPKQSGVLLEAIEKNYTQSLVTVGLEDREQKREPVWSIEVAYQTSIYTCLIHAWHPASYLSHFTAVYLHDLTEQIPKTIYLNVEQPRKIPPPKRLDQANIDAAFKRPMRKSKTVAPFGDFEICLLSSMGVLNLGVVEADEPE